MVSNFKHQWNYWQYICGLPTVKTCYVFAIVKAVVAGFSALGNLGCFLFMIYLGLTQAAGGADHNEYYGIYLSLVGVALPMFLGSIVSGIAVSCAVCLIVGIRKKSSCLVAVYLIYGIVIETTLTGATVIFMSLKFDDVIHGKLCAIYVAIAFSICVLYGIVLHVVMKTYMILRYTRKQTNCTGVQTLFLLERDGQLHVLPLAH